jgi:hypothetical protein
MSLCRLFGDMIQLRTAGIKRRISDTSVVRGEDGVPMGGGVFWTDRVLSGEVGKKQG